jgi:hypothetical protein
MYTSRTGAPTQLLLSPKHKLAPLRPGSGVAAVIHHISTADDFVENLHPAFLVFSGVGVEVNHFAVVESNAEAFLNEHVPFFLFRKCGATSPAALAHRLLLREGLTVIDQALSVGEIDCSTGLACHFMISRELGAYQLEVTAAPVLISLLVFLFK